MARIPLELMRNWQDRDVMKADDYKRERDLIVTAVNDLDAGVDGNYYDKGEVDALLLENKNSDHLGTWQGYTPDQLKDGLAITPAQIGAVAQTDFDALSDKVNKIQSQRYYLSDFPLLEGEQDDTLRIQRAIDATPDFAELIFPDTVYRISDTISVDKAISITFEGNARIEATVPDINMLEMNLDYQGNAYHYATTDIKRGDKKFQVFTTPDDIKEGSYVSLHDDYDTYFTNQEFHQVQSVTYVNSSIVANPTFTGDANLDGIADNWSAETSDNYGDSATYSTDSTEQAQKITLNNATTSTRRSVYQELSVTANNIYNLTVDTKMTNVVGNFSAQIEVAFLDASNAVLSTFITYVPNIDSYTNVKLYNNQAPANATKARIRLVAEAEVGGSGTVWFKNPDFRKSTVEITLSDMVHFDKLYSRNARVIAIKNVSNIRLRNLQLVMPTTNTTGNALYLVGLTDFHIDGLKLQNVPPNDYGVEFHKCKRGLIERVFVENFGNTTSPVGRAITVRSGSNNLTFRSCAARNLDFFIQCDTVFNITFEDVTSETCSNAINFNAPFVSNITIRNCKFYNSLRSPVEFAIGTIDLSNMFGYDITIRDNYFQMDAYNYSGLRTFLPIKRLHVTNNRFIYRNGNDPNISTSQLAGIRLHPIRTNSIISNNVFEGMYWGLLVTESSSFPVTDNDGSIVMIRDNIFKNCVEAIRMNYGNKKRYVLENNACIGITNYFCSTYSSTFGANGHTFTTFVLNGLNVEQSSSMKMWYTDGSNVQYPPRFHSGLILRGAVRNISSDLSNSVVPGASFQLTQEDYLLKGDGETILLNPSGAVTSHATAPLPAGFVEGQRLTLINMSSNAITLNKGTNMVFNGAGTTKVLDSTKRMITFIWRNGTTWYEF